MSQQLPSCFGKSWDASAPECAGGLDPSFVAPDGGNKRQRCPYFSQCASRTAASKLGQQPQQVPVAPAAPTAVKQAFPIQPVAPQHQLVQVKPAPVQQPQQVPQQVQMVPQFAPVQQQLVPPQHAQVPYMVPMNFAPAYSQMPGYLTVPEPIVPGQHWGKRLGFSVARSMLKAAGHTMANFFDHTPFNPWFPPQQ